MIIPIPNPIEQGLLAKAQLIATEAHRKQKRYTNGEPFIAHPERVAARLNEDSLKVLGWLHDVIEDNRNYPESVMRTMFPAWVVDHLLLLTHIPNEPYDDYILRAGSNPATRAVKLADLRDNLRDLKPGHQRDKYRLAVRVLGANPDSL